MAAASQEIFHGLVIAFSGVFPRAMDIEQTSEYRQFNALGGKVSRNLENEEAWTELSYLLGGQTGKTQKMKQALRRGIKVLHVSWLYASLRYLHPLNPRTFEISAAPLIAEMKWGCLAEVIYKDNSDLERSSGKFVGEASKGRDRPLFLNKDMFDKRVLA